MTEHEYLKELVGIINDLTELYNKLMAQISNPNISEKELIELIKICTDAKVISDGCKEKIKELRMFHKLQN